MKYVFLLNRFSLKNKLDAVLERIKTYAESKGFDHIIEVNNDEISTEDILEKYEKEECVVFAIGGDGSVNRVVNKIHGTKNILGVIPSGTGNDFYRTERDCFQTGINEVDLLKINDSYFLNVACFGIDAKIGNQDDVVHSKLIPESQRYNAAIVKCFSQYKPTDFHVKVGDVINTHKGRKGLCDFIDPKSSIDEKLASVIVCNARYYGRGYYVNPLGNVNDGLIDIVIPGALSKLELVRYILAMKKGKHIDMDNSRYFQTNKITITCDNEVSANVDGERLTAKKFDISVCPKKLRIYYDDDLARAINSVNPQLKMK